MNIYFNITDEELEKIKNIKDLFFSQKSTQYPFVLFKETYFDKECTKRQCHCARRSFYDLLDICKTYFPKTTEEELAHLLVNEENLCSFYCSDIQKVVFCLSSKNPYRFNRCGNKYHIEYVGKDQLCYNDIIEISKNYKQPQTS